MMSRLWHGKALKLHETGSPGVWRADLPEDAAGRWCRLSASLPGPGRWWVKVEAEDAARGHVVREVFLGPARRRLGDRWGRRWRTTLLHLPQAAGCLTVHVFFSREAPRGPPLASLRVLSRPATAVALLWSGRHALPHALAGDRLGLPGRVRAFLGQAPARAGEAPGYDAWIALYDCWGPREQAALARAPRGQPAIGVVVVGGPSAAIAATVQSLALQWRSPIQVDTVAWPADWASRGSPGEAGWMLVLQAGEVMPAHAIACFAHAARRHPRMYGFQADADCLEAGRRTSPLLKPLADPWLLRSGLPTRGACLFRTSVLAAAGRGGAGADDWRRALALSVPAGTFGGISFVLTHVPALRSGRDVPVERSAGTLPFVSIVIPSSGRSPHMLRCLHTLIDTTAYPGGFEVLLAVSCVDAGDARQRANLARAARLPGTRVLDLGMAAFNYAAANNAAVQQARGDVLLLLNDDVAPIEPTWLHRMVSVLDGTPGASAGIVGARLLYGNDSIQHDGVIMGLANLCEHAFRLAPAGDAGPYGIAELTREVSAVTGACLLLRRSLYETLGGMDEAFAVALNDVDLCLRAREGGASVVLAAGIMLHHYESLSLGRHYRGRRAGQEAIEVRQLRARWARAIAADPFYSPAASLEPGREFQPGFPPRLSPLSWIAGETPDQPS